LQQMAPGSDEGLPDVTLATDDEDDMSELETLFTQSAAEVAPADMGMPDFLTDVEAAEEPSSEPSPLSDEINVPDMPSWLMEDVPQEGDSLDSVFAKFETSEADQPVTPMPTSNEVDPALLARLDPQRRAEVDDNDPWVDALDEAPDGDFDASETLPEWYVEAMNNPDRKAEVEALSGQQLQIVELPEEMQLPRGQREPIPDWLAYATGAATPPPAAAPVAAPAAAPALSSDDDDMPDWLVGGIDEGDQAGGDDLPNWLVEAGGDEGVAEQDVPDWLLETIDEQSEPVPVIDSTPPAPVPVSTPTPTPAPTQITPPPEPQRSPVPATPEVQIDVAATLQDARQRVQNADVEGGLMAYESVVRANAGLNDVVADVSKIIKADKENAAAYRVLGDALMRQGKLQAALDTYRRALNLL
jgi:tetratricopeptide (TPR) repeat protein